MWNQSFSQIPEGQRTTHLQSIPIPFSLPSPHQLSQFSGATARGYYPKPQTNASAFQPSLSFSTTETSYQTKPTIKMSEFADSAYETVQHDVDGLQPPSAQSIDLNTFKGFRFVTVDQFHLETRDIYDEISGTFQWEMCGSEDDRCIKYIRDECTNKRVFLIPSGTLGRKVVPVAHDLPQVYAIYIYCADVVSNREWSKKYSKVRVVCNNDDQDLLPQFAVDVAQANIEWGDALIKQGNRDKAKEKFRKALDNLNRHAKKPDPSMVKKVKSKLEECK